MQLHRKKQKKTEEKPKLKRRKVIPENNTKKSDKLNNKKPGPNGGLNKKQKVLVKLYCVLPDEENSRYIAYMQAGYQGDRKSCDDLFNTDKIKKGIEDYRKEKLVIPNNNNDIGRPLKLTEQTVKVIESAIERGMSQNNAALLAGISRDTYYKWLQKGKQALDEQDKNNPYLYFLYRMKRAKPKGELKLLENIHSAADGTDKINGQWQASAWLLERTRPKQYGRNVIITEEEQPEDTAKEMFEALNMLIDTTDDDTEGETEG